MLDELNAQPTVLRSDRNTPVAATSCIHRLRACVPRKMLVLSQNPVALHHKEPRVQFVPLQIALRSLFHSLKGSPTAINVWSGQRIAALRPLLRGLLPRRHALRDYWTHQEAVNSCTLALKSGRRSQQRSQDGEHRTDVN